MKPLKCHGALSILACSTVMAQPAPEVAALLSKELPDIVGKEVLSTTQPAKFLVLLIENTGVPPVLPAVDALPARARRPSQQQSPLRRGLQDNYAASL